MFKKKMSAAVLAVAAMLAVGAAPAMASGGGGVDYSDLLEAIDFGTIATGVVGAGAALVAVYLAIKGVRLIIGFVKGG